MHYFIKKILTYLFLCFYFYTNFAYASLNKSLPDNRIAITEIKEIVFPKIILDRNQDLFITLSPISSKPVETNATIIEHFTQPALFYIESTVSTIIIDINIFNTTIALKNPSILINNKVYNVFPTPPIPIGKSPVSLYLGGSLILPKESPIPLKGVIHIPFQLMIQPAKAHNSK